MKVKLNPMCHPGIIQLSKKLNFLYRPTHPEFNRQRDQQQQQSGPSAEQINE